MAVAKAEADLADAQATLESSQTDVPITSINTDSTLRTRPFRARKTSGAG